MKKKIAILCSKQITRHADHYLANLLKLKNNYYLISVISNISSANKNFYYQKYSKYFDEIYQEPDENDSTEGNIKEKVLFKKIKEFERFYGMSLNNIFFTHRIIGGGFFASGGINHPRNALRENNSYINILKIALDQLLFWEGLLKRSNVKIALNLPNHAHFLAKKLNIKSERLQTARFGNTQFWSSDNYIQPDHLKKNFNMIKKIKKVNIDTPYDTYLTYKSMHIKQYSFLPTLYMSFFGLIKNIRGRFKGYKKSKNIFILDDFLSFWKKRKAFKKNLKLSNINSNQTKGLKYIYFPLVAEPEIALHGIAQDFFFQLSALNLLARDLPSDFKIVVKEHLLAIGRRPTDFYRQISAHKNVIFANPLDNGIPYIKNSRAVAIITGTAAWEASVMGIPVITFTQNNAFNFLEHVFYVNNPNSLKKIISDISKIKLPNRNFTQSGSRLYQAYFKSSFDLGAIKEFFDWKSLDEKSAKSYAKLLHKELSKKVKL